MWRWTRATAINGPELRQRVLDADILVLATPIWLGHPSSICQRVLERLDAELSETDDEGRMLTYDKVAAVADVGNEVGAHKVSADVFLHERHDRDQGRVAREAKTAMEEALREFQDFEARPRDNAASGEHDGEAGGRAVGQRVRGEERPEGARRTRRSLTTRAGPLPWLAVCRTARLGRGLGHIALPPAGATVPGKGSSSRQPPEGRQCSQIFPRSSPRPRNG